MFNLYANANDGPSAPHAFWNHLPSNIKICLIDESGNRVDPYQINEMDYLSRFINKCVVSKVFQKMIADKRSGVIEVYNDKVVVKEN